MAPPPALYIGGALTNVTGMVQAISSLPSNANSSAFDAPTQTRTQREELDQAHSQDPYHNLWGRLTPCNPNLKPVDFVNNQSVYKVGRLESNDIFINVDTISEKHCTITKISEEDGTTSVDVHDLTSTRGTWVNGHKMDKGGHHRITHGMELSFGAPSEDPAKDYRYIFRQSSNAVMMVGGIDKHYQLGPELGSGGFGTVYKAYSRVNGLVFAVKKIDFGNAPKAEAAVQRELAILQTVRHPYATRIIEYHEHQKTMFIVIEIVYGGDMGDCIKKHGRLGEAQTRIFIAQLVSVLVYLHNNHITHRDIKPSNILLTTSTPPYVKLADFGLAKEVNGTDPLKTQCGTPAYIAPEVYTLKKNDVYDSTVDCWSLGATMYKMLTGRECFKDLPSDSLEERVRRRKKGVDWQDFRSRTSASPDCIDFLMNLLIADPAFRMSMKVASQHPWIRGIRISPPTDWQDSEAEISDENSPLRTGTSGPSNVPSSVTGGTSPSASPSDTPSSNTPTPRTAERTLKNAEKVDGASTPTAPPTKRANVGERRRAGAGGRAKATRASDKST